MRIVSTVLLALLLASSAHAVQRWTMTYGYSSYDAANSVQQTSDGGYIVAGSSYSVSGGNYDVYLIKTNAHGDTVWTRTYGGTGQDYGYSVQQTADSGYIVAGYTTSFGAHGYDVYLIKTNDTGVVQWSRTYGGAGNDWGYSVRQTADKGYIIAGTTASFGAGVYDVYLIKTDTIGDTVWTRTFGGPQIEQGYSVQQTLDGGYIVAGSTTSFGAGSYDVYLIKTNATGGATWTRTYGGIPEDEGFSVQQTSDSGYVVAGYKNSGNYDVYLVKTNASGDTLWTRTYGGTYEDEALSVQQTSDGGYITAGKTNSFEIGGNYDVYLVRTNASGDTLWTKTYGGSGDERGDCVQQTADGGYITAGYTNSFGAGSYDAYLIKTDANGNAAVEEPTGSRQKAVGSIDAVPNLFASFTRIPGHETERFDLYDISGKMVGAYRGDRIGEGLSPAVYFIRLDEKHGGTLRVVKVR